MKTITNSLLALGLLLFIAFKSLAVTIAPAAIISLAAWLFGVPFTTAMAYVWGTLALIAGVIFVVIVLVASDR